MEAPLLRGSVTAPILTRDEERSRESRGDFELHREEEEEEEEEEEAPIH